MYLFIGATQNQRSFRSVGKVVTRPDLPDAANKAEDHFVLLFKYFVPPDAEFFDTGITGDANARWKSFCQSKKIVKEIFTVFK